MNRTREFSSHEDVIQTIKRSFSEEIRTMHQTVWSVLKSKDEEINILTLEKKLDGEEKLRLMSRITELEDHVAILTEELERKDEALMNPSSKEGLGKPAILWEENDRLRSKLSTLTHIRLKQDQENQEKIEALTKIIDDKERDLETLKNAQTKYYTSFKDKLDWFTGALKEKDEIIRTLKIKENGKFGETELSASVEENNKLKLSGKTTEKEANDKSFDAAMTSSKTYEEEELTMDDKTKHFQIPERCPMPGCNSEVKFANKSVGNLKGHLSRHFTRQIIQNFPFKPRQECPLCLEKNKKHLLTGRTGHVYHLGIVHRQIQLYVTEEEKHILKFIK